MIGIGNSSRSDDGLGWAFVDEVKKLGYFKGEMIHCYQLQVEDAEMVSRYPRVIFVDACEGEDCNGFEWAKTEALNDFTFTTHALTPEAVLFLCNDLSNCGTDTTIFVERIGDLSSSKFGCESRRGFRQKSRAARNSGEFHYIPLLTSR